MSEFNNVTVVREANVYFDGKCTSRTVIFPDGTKKTLGILLPGDYKFNTGAPEIMEILAGEMTVRIADATEWVPVKGGESFQIPGNSSFEMKVTVLADYVCSFG
ncbi:pyrimidine/purine nucleoside phosphorylase [Geomesophilobacter sediminis]|uniref:Pyrimidine/purine nucleoside phosphorylase n=1 Tax=Geomesophilobacter sediminis TaxID=2798584 RepID=A0A8J7JFU4_9BACT|nr:pyrimidine/purine nucleoside phosphorylase [Geomesophilobacter sediminis]MBJ6723090.1 pyrimidine/purine nucleoside phosphorylase [Geomesophilobacter sediminis]